MTGPSAHSPLPWRAVNAAEGVGNAWGVESATGAIVVDHDFVGETNARFIAAACNSHHDLLAALKGLRSEHPRCRTVTYQIVGGTLPADERCELCKAADAAIAKAER